MQRPDAWGINHIKLPATDILRTSEFYCQVIGTRYLPHFDHRNKDGDLFAVMLSMPHTLHSSIMIEIRHNEAQAQAQRGWDPITFGVRTKQDLEDWKLWFERSGVQCSRIFTGLKAWVLCALDPDGKIVRLYCDEEHPWTTDFNVDEFWLA